MMIPYFLDIYWKLSHLFQILRNVEKFTKLIICNQQHIFKSSIIKSILLLKAHLYNFLSIQHSHISISLIIQVNSIFQL